MHAISTNFDGRWPGLKSERLRYEWIERLRAVCDRGRLQLLTYGLGEAVFRALVVGTEGQIARALRSLKVGTSLSIRAAGGTIQWGANRVETCDWAQLSRWVRWTHDVRPPELGLLKWPWSSHRDLMGLRRASGFALNRRVRSLDAAAIHHQLGGLSRDDESTVTLLRVSRISAAVLGLLPVDRRSFALFCQVGRAMGWPVSALASALVLSTRRVRQLLQHREAALELALACVVDSRL